MKTLFATLLLMFVMVFAMAALAPTTATPDATVATDLADPVLVNLEVLTTPACQTDRTVQELALGPIRFPPRPGGVCCEMRRETRKCVRWCDPGLLPANRSMQVLGPLMRSLELALGPFPMPPRPCPGTRGCPSIADMGLYSLSSTFAFAPDIVLRI